MHELAVMAGMRAALAHVLKIFDPHAIEARLDEQGMIKMLSNRKAKLWDRFVELQAKLDGAAADDFQNLFGDAFNEPTKGRSKRCARTCTMARRWRPRPELSTIRQNMSWNNKVIWSEGMFLQPQHLQQHDRYLQTQLEARAAGLRAVRVGLHVARHRRRSCCKLGKLALLSARGVLPDGTPFDLPADDDLPEPLDIPEGTRNVLVVLALPLRRPGVAETGDERDERKSRAPSRRPTSKCATATTPTPAAR